MGSESLLAGGKKSGITLRLTKFMSIIYYFGICAGHPEAYYLETDTCSTCRLSEEGDVVRVSSECTDVPVHPGDGSLLVPQTVVT